MPNEAPAGNPQMERLLAALNECPGIFVVSSYSRLAGAGPAEEPEGEFSVSFTVDPSTGGWRSFDLILSDLRMPGLGGREPSRFSWKVAAIGLPIGWQTRSRRRWR